MAVYTDIAEDELESFLSAYPLGKLMSYRGIAEGVENSNFMLHVEGGSYILTLFERRTNERDLPFFAGLMDHLAAKGITCPQPVKRSDGQIIGRLAGRPAIIVSFLEGMWPRRPGAAHCREVGAALARMHLAALDFAIPRANALTIKDWRPLFDQAADRADEVEPGLAAEVAAELDLLEARWPTDLPRGVIHADLFPDNVFFLGEKLSGLIDFYFACNDLLAYDVAVCLNAWCFERDFSFNLTKGQAMLDGYCSVRPLSPAEAQALPVLARGAAIRFLLTRLYDWLHTPAGAVVTKKDPREYLRRLRFHRQVTSAEDYGFIPS